MTITSCSGVVKENSQLDAKLFLVAKHRPARVTAYTHFKPVMTGPVKGHADRTQERKNECETHPHSNVNLKCTVRK